MTLGPAVGSGCLGLGWGSALGALVGRRAACGGRVGPDRSLGSVVHGYHVWTLCLSSGLGLPDFTLGGSGVLSLRSMTSGSPRCGPGKSCTGTCEYVVLGASGSMGTPGRHPAGSLGARSEVPVVCPRPTWHLWRGTWKSPGMPGREESLEPGCYSELWVLAVEPRWSPQAQLLGSLASSWPRSLGFPCVCIL